MNIIELAREARLAEPIHPFNPWGASDEALERFATLVRAAALEEAAGVCAEEAMRCEADAQRAIEYGEHDEVSAIRSTAWKIGVCAAAIRALKEKT